jgi:hypothetical protein
MSDLKPWEMDWSKGPPQAPAASPPAEMKKPWELDWSKPQATQPPQATATTTVKPAAKSGFIEAAQSMGMDVVNTLLGGSQGTSPVTADVTGKSTRKELGEVIETDTGEMIAGPNNQWLRIDPKQHVLLMDPNDKKLKAYERSENTNEGPLAAVGRVAGVGMMTNPIQAAQPFLKGSLATETTSRLMDDFNKVGVKPTLAAVTNSPKVATVENLSANAIFGGKVTKARDAMSTGAGKYLDNVANGLSDIETRDSAGRVLKEGARNFQSRFQKKSGELFGKFDEMVDAKEAVPLSNTVESNRRQHGALCLKPQCRQGHHTRATTGLS